ncbi:hypothetical protein BM1_08832 [Bipolaris maydis]|nr:hypothetical protein BM1_08832 [Bipolaris maydis]
MLRCLKETYKMLGQVDDSLGCGIDETEDVVENEPLLAVLPQLEDLGEGHGLTHQERASHQDNNAAVVYRLAVNGIRAVLYLLEREVLVHNKQKDSLPGYDDRKLGNHLGS